jgi:hypothetical protein
LTRGPDVADIAGLTVEVVLGLVFPAGAWL